MSKSLRRVGIDWGSESHQVCRIDGEEEPKQRSFPHTGEGLRALVDFVVEGDMDWERIAVAIEVNHGAVVEALLIKGLRVYSINPKLLDRLRDRFSLAGAKDDRRDAFVLASCVESPEGRLRARTCSAQPPLGGRVSEDRAGQGRELSMASGDSTS